VKEVEQNVASDLHALIYDYFLSAKDYVARLPKLPYIVEDDTHLKCVCEKRRLTYLPLSHHLSMERHRTSTAFWYLRSCPIPWIQDNIGHIIGFGLIIDLLRLNPSSCMDKYLGKVRD
jgi:hypothetical protein